MRRAGAGDTATMRVAFIGTGTMGAAMARTIAAAGHELAVYNRTREKAESLAEVGATVHDSPAEAVAGADAIVTMLLDGPTTLEHAARFLPAAAAGASWWQAATISETEVGQLVGLAEQHGVGFCDGPVLGTRKPAEDGALVVLAAGHDPVLDALEPLFAAAGSRTQRQGPVPGAATRLKLVANHWIGSVLLGLADTVALAGGLGVEPQAFLDAIAGSAIDVGYAGAKVPMMASGDFQPVAFSASGALKDARLILDAAAAVDVDLGVTPTVVQRLQAAVDAGHGADDMAAINAC